MSTSKPPIRSAAKAPMKSGAKPAAPANPVAKSSDRPADKIAEKPADKLAEKSTGKPAKETVYGVRRRSREMALQLLFQTQFMPGAKENSGPATGSRDLTKRFAKDFMIEDEVAEYGTVLFAGVAEHLKEIDGTIQSCSSHWKISRMGLVDVSVMRVAVYEMKFLEPRLQPNIAINEAVEIAKKFGSTDSGAFVNGILDQIARGL